MRRSFLEHEFTSTGAKLLAHPEQLLALREGRPETVISTHVCPTGVCNQNCTYCSVRERDRHASIPVALLEEYVRLLRLRGLRAVIVSGGGEPCLYPDIQGFLQWMSGENLSIGLITNGTAFDQVRLDRVYHLKWVRVSVQNSAEWRAKVKRPELPKDTTFGASMIVGPTFSRGDLGHAVDWCEENDADYLRLCPDCLLPNGELAEAHRQIDAVLKDFPNTRNVFHQEKHPGKPQAHYCWLAHVRPLLSEHGGGTLFPCDSLVLNDHRAGFGPPFDLARSIEEVDAFLKRKVRQKFDPSKVCNGCVFHDTVDLLDMYVRGLQHEEFV